MGMSRTLRLHSGSAWATRPSLISGRHLAAPTSCPPYHARVANATLFEKVLANSGELSGKIESRRQSVLNICSLGGGPGTELLGLAKHLLRVPEKTPPRKLGFTVVDNVVGGLIRADVVGVSLMSKPAPRRLDGARLPVRMPTWSYSITSFRRTTLVTSSESAIKELARLTVFVVIDRLEHKPSFQNEAVGLFQSALGVGLR